jgi:hypothetical protein
VGSGEMPIELGDSWFSPKCIEVQPLALPPGGRALDGCGASQGLPSSTKLRMPGWCSQGVRRWGISFIVKRETAQTNR